MTSSTTQLAVFDFALVNEQGESFPIGFDVAKPDTSAVGERFVHLGRGPFLKLDNKHVSRQQVKLSLNFATGLANVVSLGTNPTTVVRASGGELLLDANQLYAINPNDTICLWRAECRYRFVAQLKPGFSVPLLPDQPLVSDADAASNAKSKNGGIDGEDDDDDDDDDDDVSALVIGGAPPPPAVAPFTPPAPLRIDTVTNSIDDDEDDVNSRALTESETSASVSKQYSGAKGALAFVSPMRRGSSRLALQSTVPGGASSTASNAADAGASAGDERVAASSKSGDDNDDWPLAVLHGALLRRLESQAREIGSLHAQLAHAHATIDKLDRKLRSAAKRLKQEKPDSDDSGPTPLAGTSADSIPDMSQAPTSAIVGSLVASAGGAADSSPPMTPELRASRGPTLLSPRGSPVPPVVDMPGGDDTDDDEEAQAEKRQHVINEILSTERDYLRDLRWVLEQYVEPIKASNVINARDQQHLFSNLASLCHLHEEILSMLEKSTAAGANAAIGQTFLRIGSYLKVYATYVTDQEGTREFIIAKRAESPQFAEHCEMVKALPQSRSLDLEAFLIKPVQRVCQYPLLIEQLLKATPRSLPDRKLLGEALESVRSVANHVNESKRSVAMIARVAQISKSMSGLPRNFELAVATRRFLYEGALSAIGVDASSPSLNRKPQKTAAANRQAVYCFLFNDALIESKSKGAKFVVRQLLMLDGDTVGEQVPHEMEPYAFQLVRKQHGQRQTFMYVCDSADDAESWMSQLSKVVKFTMLVRKSATLRKENRSNSIGGAAMMRQPSFRGANK